MLEGNKMTNKQIKRAIELASLEIKEWELFREKMKQLLFEKAKKSKFKKGKK